MVSKAFNETTHRELVTMLREFYPDGTHFFSLLKYIVISSKMIM
jgi:hypothetical protein